MSTKHSIYYAEDQSGVACHIYWELAERIVNEGRMIAAPIMMAFESLTGPVNELPSPIRLSPEIGRQICEAVGKPADVEII